MFPRSDAGQAAILMYHRIADPDPDQDAGYCVSPRHFRAHLAQLHERGFNVVSLQALVREQSRGRLSPRSVVITFDDGYADTLREAAPILREFSYPATVFVVSGVLNGMSEFWWNLVDRVFDDKRVVPSELRLRVADDVLITSTSRPSERRAARERIRHKLVATSLPERERVLAELVAWSDLRDGPGADVRPLTAEEIVDLASIPGIEIGAHSANHLWLPSQPRPVVMREIAASRNQLETLLGRPVISFAYPYGAHDAAVIDAVRATGFNVAVTTERCPVSNTTDLLALPRYEVLNRDRLEFEEVPSGRGGPAA